MNPKSIDWGQWPEPHPDRGDGAEHGESPRNDGTPGAVADEQESAL